jgi:penicillin-binding protein 1A
MQEQTSFLHRCTRAIRRHPFAFVALLILLPLVAAATAAALYVSSIIPKAPSLDDIRRVRNDMPSVIMSADGKQLAMFRRSIRERVKLAEISPNVVKALLATEDRRFYEHKGLDVRRTLAAAFRTARGELQGGSTITQQLARNLFPEEIGRAPTIERKLKEAITALRLEQVYTKDQILELYLNTVPFLYNTFGIEMAARTYFSRSAGELDLLQAATLIGMLKGTTYYNPVLNPERAVQRRNLVLAQMTRGGDLDGARYEAMKKQPLGLDFEKQPEEDLGPAPHLALLLKRWLVSWADTHGYNLHADGLVVHTTIDSRLQQVAIDAVNRQADKLQQLADKTYAKPGANRQLLETLLRETPRFRAEVEHGLAAPEALRKVMADADFMRAFWREKTWLQAGFVAEDPRNGHVKAWVGSRGFDNDQFDHVQQARRQPGSTFKPFVYGAAFAQGISVGQTYIDEPMEFRIDARTVWKPTDVHDSTHLPMTLRDGLVFSKNTITAQLVQRVGPASVAQLARAMGVRQSKLDVVPSLALGTSPVTLKEMVSAYSTIANNGAYIEPVLVLRIENAKGEVLQAFAPPVPEQALDVAADQVLLDVMRGVVERGTGAGIRSKFGLKGDFAGKTGTTQDNTDGWFVLMHPQLVAGAWVGFNDARVTMPDSWGQGARNAMLVVGDFMQQSIKAGIVEASARFDAPRLPDFQPLDPALMAQANDQWAQLASGSNEMRGAPQPAVVVIEPSRQYPPGDPYDTPEPRVERSRPRVQEPPAAVPGTPEFRWLPQLRTSNDPAPAVQHPAPPAPDYGRSSATEMGGPPAGSSYEQPPAPRPRSGGIPILRSY